MKSEYTIKRDGKQIDDLMNTCSDQEMEGGSKYPGMTYEQGIKAAIEWITGLEDSNPMDD